MHLIEEQYCIFDIVFTKALGIWPHDRSRFVILRNILLIILMVSHIYLQLLVLTTDYTIALFIRVMMFACLSMISVLVYVSFLFKSKVIRNLHHQIEEDWMLLRDKLEIDIIQKTVRENHFYIVIFFLYSILVIIGAIVIQFFPIVLDIVFPLNASRPRRLFIMVEYFAFHNKYFYTKVLHELIFVTVNVAIIFAAATQFLVLAIHALGMFKLARHRIEHSVEECVLNVPRPEKEHAIRKRIMHATIAHRRAMEFSLIMVSSFDSMYCVVVILGVMSLSMSLYGIIEATTISKSLEMLLFSVSLSLGLMSYMFLAFSFDQKLTDTHDEIFRAIYATSWYLMPVPSQKLILFLLQKTGKEFYIKIGFVFVSKIQNFATVLNTSLSYVAVMYSIRQ